MRRRLLTVVTTVGVGAALALPGISAAQVPTQDSVTGTGLLPRPSISFFFDAHSGPSGEAPSGSARLVTEIFGTLQGPVTCLEVFENFATFNFVDPVRGVVAVNVSDLATGDRIRPGFSAGPPSDCQGVPFQVPDFLVLEGDLIVTDAPALPTSKDQCKNGGWHTYGSFRNQGDCVSFVATKGKNPPGKTSG